VANLILPRRFTSQPQYPVEINQIPGLRMAFNFAPSCKTNCLVTNTPLILGTSGTLNYNGLNVSSSGGATYFTVPYTVAAPFSVVIVYIRTGGTVTWSLGRVDTWSGIYSDDAVGTIKSTNNADFSGAISPPKGGSFFQPNNFYCTAVTVGGNNDLRGCNNGGAITIDSSLTAPSGTINRFVFGRDPYLSNNASGVFQFLAIFDRKLSDSELQSYSANPWQIFRKRPQILYFDAGGGGATTLDAAAGSYSVTGQIATFSLSQSSVVGSYSVAGQTANFQSVLNVATGSYSVTGVDATLTATGLDSKTLSADAGNYVLTGQASSFATNLVASAGSYSVTGQATALNINTSAATGSYTITGVAADLIPTGISSFTISAEAGSFSLTGSAATFDLTAKAAASSYSVTGSSATFSTTLPLQAGSYVVTGVDANLDAQVSLTISAEAGSFSLIGKAADLILTGTLQQKDGTSKKKKIDKTKEQLELERIFGKEESTEELILKFIDPIVKIPTDVLRKEVAEVAAKPTSAVLLDYLVEVKQTVAKEEQVKITQAIQQYTEAQVKIKKKKVAKKREEELLLMWMI